MDLFRDLLQGFVNRKWYQITSWLSLRRLQFNMSPNSELILTCKKLLHQLSKWLVVRWSVWWLFSMPLNHQMRPISCESIWRNVIAQRARVKAREKETEREKSNIILLPISIDKPYHQMPLNFRALLKYEFQFHKHSHTRLLCGFFPVYIEATNGDHRE